MKNRFINLSEIGKRIRDLRISKGLTQQELSEILSVTDNHICKIETGNTSVSLNVLINLCNCFDSSIDYLIFGTLKENQTINDVIISSILSTLDETDKDYIITMLKGLQLYKLNKNIS